MSTSEEILFQEPRKTFMEILKVHKKEVPFANVLAYFFRPNEKHGLGTLFLDAFLETVFNSNELIDYRKDEVKVIVEEKTKNDNRIDLLISSNTFVICIEFKINHDLDNPLDDYKEFIENNKNYKDKQKFYFILTPYKKDPIGKAKVYFQNNNDFKQIVLRHFIDRVSEKIKGCNFELNDDYQYFQDFVQTVKNRAIRSNRYLFLEQLKKELKKQKINSQYHSNINGGFLEIGNLKVRIKENGIQIEKWNNDKNEIIFGPDKEKKQLVEILRNSNGK